MTQTLGATIADEARFVGTYKGQDLTVLGGFEGGLELSGRLHLGPDARVKGHVKAAAVEIEGEFEGEVRAETLSFGARARARGVFLAPRLCVRDGACVEGALNVEPASTGAASVETRKAGKAKPAPSTVRAEAAPETAAQPVAQVEPQGAPPVAVPA